jgi:hypothetical protein
MHAEEVCSACYNIFFCQTVTVAFMLMFFRYLTYAFYIREDVNLMQFFSLMFSWFVNLNLLCLPHTLFVFQLPHRTSETLLCSCQSILQKPLHHQVCHCGKFSAL